MKIIPLTQGKVALVDDQDFDQLNQHNWCADKRQIRGYVFWYARRNMPITKKKIYMHREIAAVAGIEKVDHRDGNGLNNQRENLRSATHKQNMCNRRKAENCTSKFKGVSWDKRKGKWRVVIAPNGHQKFLGYFTDELAAAAAYDHAAVLIFQNYARVNAPTTQSKTVLHKD